MELNFSPAFWQAVIERGKNMERIANPEEKSKSLFMYRNLASLVLRQLEIFREEALHLKISLRIYSPKHLVFYYLLLTSDWQSAKGKKVVSTQHHSVMKKTFSVIVSILALAGSAHAAIVFDYQADPQVTADFYQPEVTGLS